MEDSPAFSSAFVGARGAFDGPVKRQHIAVATCIIILNHN